jgi:Cu+-exporting ATPase
MQIDEKKAAGKSDYQGQTYYFCSTACKNEFDRNPEQYAEKRASTASSAKMPQS